MKYDFDLISYCLNIDNLNDVKLKFSSDNNSLSYKILNNKVLIKYNLNSMLTRDVGTISINFDDNRLADFCIKFYSSSLSYYNDNTININFETKLSIEKNFLTSIKIGITKSNSLTLFNNLFFKLSKRKIDDSILVLFPNINFNTLFSLILFLDYENINTITNFKEYFEIENLKDDVSYPFNLDNDNLLKDDLFLKHLNDYRYKIINRG